MIEEEARAGWVLVEKLDSYRVRFKRPRSAREADHLLEPGYDPYRTEYGGNPAVVVGIVLAILLAMGLVFGIFMADNASETSATILPIIVIILGVLGLLSVFLVKARSGRR